MLTLTLTITAFLLGYFWPRIVDFVLDLLLTPKMRRGRGVGEGK